MAISGLALFNNLALLDLTHHVDDPLIDLVKITIRQRPPVDLAHVFKNNLFPRRLVDGHAGVALQLADFLRGLCALVEQFHQSAIQSINLLAPAGYIHDSALSKQQLCLRTKNFIKLAAIKNNLMMLTA